ncbi:MAG: DUF2141 domain-containing protein [Scytonema sp. PMC 1069.18]|nr:DUF2141 domain-containing protein [Scytonema sp. PMC 1069.18]MEC4881361.1 DUF2141 domain-containing protein [Scytonema sp. PMC 1070.18]
MKLGKISSILLALLANISIIKTVNAGSTSTLTVVIDGIRHQKGQICLRVFADERGFPMNNTSEVQSDCIQITGNSLKKQFSGLKPGTYAVAVVDDQNGDQTLNKDFLGIPQEGFGISKNPTVSIFTGTPKFRDASFPVKTNTTINIKMKYSLDS